MMFMSLLVDKKLKYLPYITTEMQINFIIQIIIQGKALFYSFETVSILDREEISQEVSEQPKHNNHNKKNDKTIC